MTEENKSFMEYRLERADESLVEAKAMSAMGHWNTAANRLYYACFYSLTALYLAGEEKEPLSHAGVKTKFNNDFVRTGRVSKGQGQFYNSLFSKRQDGDYKDLIRFDGNKILPLIEETALFIQAIKQLINQTNNQKTDNIS